MKEICINRTQYILLLIAAFLGGIMIGLVLTEINCEKHNDNIITDTIYVERDSILEYTKTLDSIKENEIKKVYTLDDSSTIELFIKLVSE